MSGAIEPTRTTEGGESIGSEKGRDAGRGRGTGWWLVALIALIGLQTRAVILGVPVVLPAVRADLHLTFSATGALTSIPIVGLGVASIPGAILVNRFGARKVVGAAIFGTGLAALLRIAPPQPYSLYVWTAVLSLAVAVAQPAIMVLIRSWFPDRVQQASTVYAMSLAVGGLAGATLSIYLLVLAGWRGTFAILALLAIASAGLWMLLAPGRGIAHEPTPHGLGHLIKQREVWHAAALFGGQSLVFFASITWIPFVLRGYSPNYLALVLFLFQLVSVPLIAGLAVVRLPWASSRLWYAAGGVMMTSGCLAFALNLTGLAWVWAPLLGCGSGMMFAGATAMPALIARSRSEVAGYAALMLTAGYALAFLGPVAGGIALDITHVITSPFWVTTAVALITTVVGALPRGVRTRAQQAEPSLP